MTKTSEADYTRERRVIPGLMANPKLATNRINSTCVILSSVSRKAGKHSFPSPNSHTAIKFTLKLGYCHLRKSRGISLVKEGFHD